MFFWPAKTHFDDALPKPRVRQCAQWCHQDFFFRIRLFFNFVWEQDFGRNSDVVAFDYWEVNGSWWQPLPTKNIWFWYNIKSYFVRRNPLYFFWTGNIKFCGCCMYVLKIIGLQCCALNSSKIWIWKSCIVFFKGCLLKYLRSKYSFFMA